MRAEETKIEQEGERNLKQKESKSVRMIWESRIQRRDEEKSIEGGWEAKSKKQQQKQKQQQQLKQQQQQQQQQ